MHTRIARAATLVAVILVAVGCTKSLDTSSLESALKSQVESEFNASGLTISCPDNIKVEAGGTFECTATDQSGQSVTIEVTQKDDRRGGDRIEAHRGHPEGRSGRRQLEALGSGSRVIVDAHRDAHHVRSPSCCSRRSAS